MDILYFAQTAFYLTFSFFVIAIGVLLFLIIYNLLVLVKYLRHISQNLENASEEIKNNIIAIIERISELPPFSFFMKDHAKKGRKSKK